MRLLSPNKRIAFITPSLIMEFNNFYIMDLIDFIEYLKSKIAHLVVLAIVGGLIGVILYYAFPAKYMATGSFFITRKVENAGTLEVSPQQNFVGSSEFFSYEGFYAQQAAVSYSKSVAALFESVDVRSQVLTNLGVPVNADSLRRLNKDLRVEKPDTQLVEVSIKANNPSQAEETFTAFSQVIGDTTAQLNQNGDTFLVISPVFSSPVVHETYSNLLLNLLVGTLIGLSFGVGFYGIEFALREEKK